MSLWSIKWWLRHLILRRDISPEGTMMLEPREMYDKAYLRSEVVNGVACAVYSTEKCIRLLYDQFIKDGQPEDEAIDSAVEWFYFNTSGSMGQGFPVFQDDREVE